MTDSSNFSVFNDISKMNIGGRVYTLGANANPLGGGGVIIPT